MILATLATLNGAAAATLKVSGAEASSTYPPSDEFSYEPRFAHDRKASTSWFEGDASGSGLGQWLRLDLDGEHDVASLLLWNGCWASYDMWTRNNRIKEVEVEFSDGSKETFTLKDEMAAEPVKFARPHKTTSVKLKIKSVYKGTTFTDTAISEVLVMDTRPDEAVPVSRYGSSSVYPADADGSYEPAKVGDLVLDTMWCEAAQKDGDGTGEWIELDFGKAQTVSKLSIVNGNGGDMKYWMKSNRASKAQLSFSDGSTQSVEVKKTISPQVIDLSPVSTTRVRITFTEVTRGTDPAMNDLCVSEVAFMP